jgi:hypothetical protein
MCAGCHEDRRKAVILEPSIIGKRPHTALGRAAVGNELVWSIDSLLRLMISPPVADEKLKQSHRVGDGMLRCAITLFLSEGHK